MKVFIVGYMSSGKTRFGKRLAKALNLPFIDLDQVVLERTQRTAGTWIREYGEERFRQTELLCLLHCLEKEEFVMATGGGTPCFFDNMERMNKEGITVWLKTPFGRILQRLRNKAGDRPLVATVDGVIDSEAVERHYSGRLSYYSKATIISEENDVEFVVKKITGN
ncbi:Shikimate kinase [bioreactor metagenome]|uniref:Shikimate kinase n=1 Tax=bioreactor metagenome TaxID=1076179 RepID=A0A644WI72_9ZZZZ